MKHKNRPHASQISIHICLIHANTNHMESWNFGWKVGMFMIRLAAGLAGVLLLFSIVWNTAYADIGNQENGIKTINIKKSKENNVLLKPNIVYSTPANKPLKLHLLIPKNAGPSLPLIIYIKGGGWGKDHPQKTFRFIPQLVQFAKQGYVVASVQHRTSREAKFPAQLHDIQAAVRYLKKHAAKFHIDPKRVGVWGSSSGGHLAALLGTSSGVKHLEEKTRNDNIDSSVQAVVDWYGPTDLLKMSQFPSKVDFDAPDSPESTLIGGPLQKNKAKVELANPIRYVTPDDPPFLIMHGDKDKRVPYNQSVLLYQALKKAKVEVTMYQIEGAGHGGFAHPIILETVEKFFDAHLKNQR